MTNISRVSTAIFVLVVAAVVIFAIFRIWQDPEGRFATCQKMLGGKNSVGIKLSPDEKTWAFDFGASSESSQAINKDLLEKIVECMRVETGADPFIDYERIPQPVTLGSMIDTWVQSRSATPSKLNVTVSPLNDVNLNNLLFGPDEGPRWRVVKDWCERHEAAKCVTCGGPIDDQTTAVHISRLPEAKFKKNLLGKAGSAPPAGQERPVWQLVEGENWVAFSCEAP